MSTKESHFVKAISWDQSKRASDASTTSISKKIAWASGIVAGLSVLSVSALLPLKQLVPAVIRVDNITGTYEVTNPGEGLSVADKRNEKIMMSDLSRYIRAREGFTRGEAEFNYKTGYLMSCGTVRGEWEQFYLPENNPNSPIKTMTATDGIGLSH